MRYDESDLARLVAQKAHEPLFDTERAALHGNYLLLCRKDSTPPKGSPDHHRLGGLDERALQELAARVVEEEREGLLLADERPEGKLAFGPLGNVRLILNDFELEVMRQLERQPTSDLDWYLEGAE